MTLLIVPSRIVKGQWVIEYSDEKILKVTFMESG